MTDRTVEPRPSDTILERLKKLHPKSIDLVLDRIERLLTALGNPEARLPPVFHVAGTNGKGSTVAFLRAMLEASGKRVHVYTSPHLVRFHERIRLAGKLIDEDELSMLLDECERANGGEPITFFEITTAAALLAFTRHAADAVVLETGLGGRLDATNVVKRPAATLITPIGLDHQQYLGDSLKEIAGEKAGILKRGVRAIIGPQADEVRSLLETRADRIDAPLLAFGQDFSAHEEHGRMVYQDDRGLIDLAMPKLVGRHQLANAAVAIAALRHTAGFLISDSAIDKGMTTVEWPARLQRLSKGPLIDSSPDGSEVWIDGGHNPHAAAAIAQAMADLEERAPRPLYIICGMLTTKDARGFLIHFRGLARHVTTIEIFGESASYGAGALYDIARSIGIPSDPAELIDDAMAQIEARSQITANEPPPRILICGSLYLAGRVLSENK
jgi:dihydrofolate synthase/folylpolyglutamate synthase